MKILIDASSIVNKTTGAGQYSLQLLKALSEIDDKNEYFIVLQQTLKDTHPIYTLRNKSNFYLIKGNTPSVGPKKQFYYYKLLRRNCFKFDLLHSLNSELPLYCNVKTIVTIYDLKYIKYPYFFDDFSIIKSRYLKYTMKKGAEKANKIIAVSQSTKKDIINLLGIEQEKIRVIYAASNLELYSQKNYNISNSKILKKYSIKKPYFLYVGEKRPHKNLKGLIQAFALFKHKYDRWNTYLVITGKKYSSYNEYIYEAEKLKIMDSLIFTEFVPDEYLKVVYSEAEALLLISFYEGFGIPILEAMECGTPVITSNISSMPEVAGDAAILVDPNNPEKIADAMYKVRTIDGLREGLIKKGFRRVKDFSWQKAARQVLELYKKACEIDLPQRG
ncbi:glycosyltransferase family 4 protein [bacterium]|nr:glycosyltransferase family 4 protein [bacterium]MBU4511040.1 glycosyltransferase family 4 protein [bacterium]